MSQMIPTPCPAAALPGRFDLILDTIERHRRVIDARLSRPARWRGLLRRERRGRTAEDERARVAAVFDAFVARTIAGERPRIDADLLRRTHAAASGGDRFRAGPILVGRAHHFPRPCDLERMVDECLARADASNEPAPLAAARLQLELLRIHPFRDGNGRTSRLLSSLMLLRAGYCSTLLTVVEQHFEQSPSAYIRAFRDLIAGAIDEREWIAIALSAMARRSQWAAAALVADEAAGAALALGRLRPCQQKALAAQRDRVDEELAADLFAAPGSDGPMDPPLPPHDLPPVDTPTDTPTDTPADGDDNDGPSPSDDDGEDDGDDSPDEGDDDNGDDDGDDDDDDISCSADMEGPDCLCIGDIGTYVVTGDCDGFCSDWTIDPPDRATFVNIDDCSAEIRAVKVGEFTVSAVFQSDAGDIDTSCDTSIYNVAHVLGGTSTAVVGTVPLFQPHPFLQIKKPKETNDDECLSNGVDFRVHKQKLEDDFNFLGDPDPAQRLTLKDLEERIEIELKVTGTITDFFREILSCRWTVESDHGRRTTSGTLEKPVEFDDQSFHTRIPGEAHVDPRVIVLTGFGDHDVRIFASNAIERVGTDWITVSIGMSEDDAKNIADLQKHLADLLRRGPGHNTPAAYEQEMANAAAALDNAYFAALVDPCVQVAWNDQDQQSFVMLPSDQTRTQIHDVDDPPRPTELGATVETIIDSHPLVCREEIPEFYLNQKPVRNYWVTQDDYQFHVYKWETDGVMRGQRATPVVSGFDDCCDAEAPIFGVEAEVPDCVTLKDIDDEIALTADGQPAMFNNVPGLYRWSVIARPDADATASVTPSGWTPQRSVTLKVDTPGRYTVKVEYQLGGRQCSLTYDIADLKVLTTPTLECIWDVHRVGRYSGKIAEHVALPYYDERVAAPTRAAEMLIVPKPKSSGSGGAKKPGDLGKRFQASFVIPPEIEFDDGLTIRAYFKPYSSTLTKADYKDFTGPPYVTITPDAPYQAVVDVHTKKTIRAVHLMNVQYKNVQRLHGQAVPISFAYKDPEEEVCPDSYMAGGGTMATVGPTGLAAQMAVLEDPKATPAQTNDGYHTENPPLVNLIVYNRDLGRPAASNAQFQVTNAGDQHNTANGNLFFELPVVLAFGHGIPMALHLAYNSLQASYQDSLELYQDLNDVSDEDLERFWSGNPVGKGWTHSYALEVRYYVKPADINGKVLNFFAEVVGPDGNRVQFRQTIGGADGNGTYEPVVQSDFWMGSAEAGHSLVLRHNDDTSTLKARDGTEWTFTKGKLSEITTPLTRNTTTKSVRLKIQNGKLSIKDSSDRETNIAVTSDLAFTGPVLFELPDDTKTTLQLSDGRLTRIDRKSLQQWDADYHDDLGQADLNSLLKTLNDPEGHDATYDYYEGEAFEGVPEETARNFWGRIGKVGKGDDQPRTHRWFYEGFDTKEQTVVYRNPRGVDLVVTLDVKRLALTGIAYIRKQRDGKTGTIKADPQYDPAKQNSASFHPARARWYGYYRDTKLVTDSTDVMGFITSNGYEAAAGGKGYRLIKVDQPDGVSRAIHYDAQTGLPQTMTPPYRSNESEPSKEDSWQFKYDPKTWQLKSVTHPRVTVVDKVVSGIAQSWVYRPGDGKLGTLTDLSGTEWTFKYGEADRDKYRSGQPTSRSVTLKELDAWLSTLVTAAGLPAKARPRTWRTTYDKLGRATETFEPFNGEVQKVSFHPLGEIETTDLQPMLTARGKVEGAPTIATYDGMLRKTAMQTPYAGESWSITEHGQAEWYTDAADTTVDLTYLPSGEVETRNNGGDGTTFYDYDELGRVILKRFPRPDDRTAPDQSDAYAVTIEYDDAGQAITSRRRLLNTSTNELGDVLLTNVDIFQNGRLRERQTRHGDGANTTFEKVSFRYDAWGKPYETAWHDGDTFVRRVEITRDEWGRDVAESHENINASERRYVGLARDNDGRVVSSRTRPIVGAFGQGQGPSQEYDEVGRLIATRDADGVVVHATYYDDFGNDPDKKDAVANTFEWKQDPSAPEGTDRLIFARLTQFNRRGLSVWYRTDLATQTAGEHQFRYDVMGRLVEEEDVDGVTTYYELDGLGRHLSVARERQVQKTGTTLKDLARNRKTTVVKERLTISETTYAWNGDVDTSTTQSVTTRYEYDVHGRRIRTLRSLAGIGVEQEVEQVFYDAMDRIKHRVAPGGFDQRFTFDDQARSVTARFKGPDGDSGADLQLDWQGFLKSYSVEAYSLKGAPLLPAYQASPVRLEFDYHDLGDLKEKRYLTPDGKALAVLAYRKYTPIGMPREQTLTLSRPGWNSSIECTRSFAYDQHGYLARIDSSNNATLRDGKKRLFSFFYNRAGCLRRFVRPRWNESTKDFEPGITTEFAQDSSGRGTRIADAVDPQHPIAELRLIYSGHRTSFLGGASFPFDVIDLGNANSLKRVLYRISDPASNQQLTYYRDIARDGDGDVRTWLTSYTDPAIIREDWRTTEVRPANSSVLSHRRYRHQATAPGAAIDEYNYTLENRTTAYGAIRDTLGTRNTQTPFDAFLGNTPSAKGPDGRKQTFREQRMRSADSDWPMSATLVMEDPAKSGVPMNHEFQKTYRHDAAGRLLNATQELVPRAGHGAGFVSNAGTGEHSYQNDFVVFIGPDGSEMARRLVPGGGGTVTEHVRITDGDALIAEFNLNAMPFDVYETVPGSGNRLAATSGQFLGGVGLSHHSVAAVTGEVFYHWDQDGATTFLTDSLCRTAAVYGLAQPDGQTDNFGEPGDPAASPHVHSAELHGMNTGAWGLYDASPMPLDAAVIKAAAQHQRNDHVLAMSADPTRPAMGANDYTTLLLPFKFPTINYTLSEKIVQGILDGVRGIGDALTLGYASDARAAMWDYDPELVQVRNPYAFFGGYVVGFAIGMYLGWSGMGLLSGTTTVSWAARAALLYTVVVDLFTFVQSVRAIYAGKAAWTDYLGLAAPVSYFSSLRALRARNLKLAMAIEMAGNGRALRMVVETAERVYADVKPTAKMLLDHHLVEDIVRYGGHEETSIAQASKGRALEVAEVLGKELGISEIVLSETQRTLMQERLGVKPPSVMRTVGDVDEYLRAVWHEIHNPGSGVHAGHRLDLVYNNIQARWEPRAFLMMVEFVEGGRVDSAKNLVRNLFNMHLAPANLSSGAAVAGPLARRFENGKIIDGTTIVFRLLSS